MSEQTPTKSHKESEIHTQACKLLHALKTLYFAYMSEQTLFPLDVKAPHGHSRHEGRNNRNLTGTFSALRCKFVVSIYSRRMAMQLAMYKC